MRRGVSGRVMGAEEFALTAKEMQMSFAQLWLTIWMERAAMGASEKTEDASYEPKEKAPPLPSQSVRVIAPSLTLGVVVKEKDKPNG